MLLVQQLLDFVGELVRPKGAGIGKGGTGWYLLKPVV